MTQAPAHTDTNTSRESGLTAAEYLELLDIREDEYLGFLWIEADPVDPAKPIKHTAVETPEGAIKTSALLCDTRFDPFNAWMAPNPTAGPARNDNGRGADEQTTRLAAIFGDIDVKPGACDDIAQAWQIVYEVSDRIGERPTLVIESGGGLQPIWALQDCEIGWGRVLLRRFGRLVKLVGEERCVKLDSVFDTSRVLRIPNSQNHKYEDGPRPVVAHRGEGDPMDPSTLEEHLDAAGIRTLDGDDMAGVGDVVLPETNWTHREVESCGYAAAVRSRWMTDTVTERHPWLFCCFVRLECMRRHGCLTESDYKSIAHGLERRFGQELKKGKVRAEQPGEIADIRKRAVEIASRKTDGGMASEFGGHVHLVGLPASTTAAPPPTTQERQEYPPQADSAPAAATPEGSLDTAAAQQDADPQEEQFAKAIEERIAKLYVEDEARRQYKERTEPPIILPDFPSLRELLAQPDEGPEYFIDGLAPADGRTLTSAPRKAGKTTLVGNLIRAAADGGDFLGKFKVLAPKKNIVLIDDELSERLVRKWLREQDIENQDRVAKVCSIKGKLSLFNILDDRCRDMWAEMLGELECDFLILDCLRPILDALGLDENHDAGQFLVAYDELLDQAGVPDSNVIHHHGHGGERARGDSRLQDWPDALWRIVQKDADDPASERYFSAFGRDVEVEEGLLAYDKQTRSLTLEGGSRKQAKAASARSDALGKVVDLLAGHYLSPLTSDDGRPLEASKRTMRAEMSKRHKIGNHRVDEALEAGVEQGLLETAPGRGRATVYSVVNPCEVCGSPVTEPNSAIHLDCR